MAVSVRRRTTPITTPPNTERRVRATGTGPVVLKNSLEVQSMSTGLGT